MAESNLPVPGAKVTLCYPASPAQLDISAYTEASGTFRLPVHGTYRVATVGPVEWARRSAFDAIASWLKSAWEIKLSEDKMSAIALEARLQ
jgi:hypothetical protein